MISITLCAHAHVYAKAQVGLQCCYYDTGHFILRQSFSGLKLANWSKLAGQEASQILLSLTPVLESRAHAPIPTVLLSMGSGDRIQPSLRPL